MPCEIEQLRSSVQPVYDRLKSIKGTALNGLQTDGAHHKQWFLETILTLCLLPGERVNVSNTWEKGIAP
jgi:hypothetical protein